jgi:hypothetical protein
MHTDLGERWMLDLGCSADATSVFSGQSSNLLLAK